VSAPAGEHLPLELLIDYFADDVEPAQLDAIEGHLFACTSCTAEAERVVQVVASLRALPPVGITRAQIAALQARGVRVREADFAAEVRKVAEFTPGDDVLIHHLSGLDLAHAERVHVTVKVESSGATLVEDHFAPFDRERGAERFGEPPRAPELECLAGQRPSNSRPNSRLRWPSPRAAAWPSPPGTASVAPRPRTGRGACARSCDRGVLDLVEERAPRGHVVDRARERVDVRARVELHRVQHLLGRDVARRCPRRSGRPPRLGHPRCARTMPKSMTTVASGGVAGSRCFCGRSARRRRAAGAARGWPA
jgi:hypothetical protein